MKANVYLTFDGNCAEAFDFYKSVFGGAFTWKSTFAESPMKDAVPKEKMNHVMHVSLPIGDGMDLMGSDYNPLMHKTKFIQGTNTQISLSLDDREEADKLFAKLASNGGSADHPLKDMFWGSYFGYLTDQFGIQWMIDCSDKSDHKEDIRKAAKAIRTVAQVVIDAADQLEKLAEEPPSKKLKN